MSLTLTGSPTWVPQGQRALVTLTVANQGDAVQLSQLGFVVDQALVDIGTVALISEQSTWAVSPAKIQNQEVLFTATGPASGLLLDNGALSFDLQVSSAAQPGNIYVIAIVGGQQVQLGPVSVAVTNQVAFTSLDLQPAQAGKGKPVTLSWQTVGAQSCLLAWTPSNAVVVQYEGETSQLGDTSMSVGTSGQATLTASATAHLTLAATAADNTVRQQQFSLWFPDLALQVQGNSPYLLDPNTPLTIPYSVVSDPTVPTSIALVWSGDQQVTVTQNSSPVSNGGQLAAPSGSVVVVISGSTTLTFIASRADGVTSAVPFSLVCGGEVEISLYSGGAYDAYMHVDAVAQGQTWSQDTGTLTAGFTGRIYIPADATSVNVVAHGWDFGWDSIASWSFSSPGNGLSFATRGSLFKWWADQT